MTDINEAIKQLVQLGADRAAVSVLSVNDGGRQFLMTPSGITATDITDAVLKSLPNPQHRADTVTLLNIESFSDFVLRYQQPTTVLFADQTKPRITAVFDYHDAINIERDYIPAIEAPEDHIPAPVPPPLPQWGRFRAVFNFPQSQQYLIWAGADRKPKTQAELAQFIEDNTLDILEPDAIGDDAALARAVKSLGIRLGGQAAILEASRGLSVTSTEQIIQAVNIATGEVQIGYTQSHTDNSRAQLSIPSGFLIGLPIFEGGARYRLLVRLHYRKEGNALKWHIDIFQIENAFRDAFTSESQGAQGRTGAPLFYGQAPGLA